MPVKLKHSHPSVEHKDREMEDKLEQAEAANPEPETASVPEPEAQPETPVVVPTPASEPEEVTVSIVAPLNVQRFTLPTAGGNKLTIDRNGVKVDAVAVDSIVKTAAKSGVTVKVEK